MSNVILNRSRLRETKVFPHEEHEYPEVCQGWMFGWGHRLILRGLEDALRREVVG
jgi:hypothetical protein